MVMLFDKRKHECSALKVNVGLPAKACGRSVG